MQPPDRFPYSPDVPEGSGGRPASDVSGARDVLRQARALAEPDELAVLDMLDLRWERRRLQVLVAGEAKRGKSSLVNALIGQALLPTGITPLTSVTTTVSAVGGRGSEHLSVTLHDGRVLDEPLSHLASYVTESQNPSNTLGVHSVTAWVHSPLLSDYEVDLLDTPGIGSVHVHNTEEARAALSRMDAAVVVLSVDPPITAAEKDLLSTVLDGSVRTFVLINKCDRFTPDEVRESVAFTKHVCAAVGGDDLDPIPCSVIGGEDDPGFRGFRAVLLDYLSRRGGDDVRVALRRHTRRAISTMRERRQVERRALELAIAGEAQQVSALRERLNAISGQRSEISDRVAGSLKRLSNELTRSATSAVPAITDECLAAVDLQWAASEALPLTDAEAECRSTISDHLSAAVDRWRRERGQHLQEALERLAARAHSDTEAQVALARHAVSQALEIHVVDDDPEVPLPLDTRFRFDFTPGVSWAPPLQGLADRLRTPHARRRRSLTALHKSVGPLADRQVGRARSDLQSRLEEAATNLVRRLDARLDTTVSALVLVLERASSTAASERDRMERLRELTDADAALSALLARTEISDP